MARLHDGSIAFLMTHFPSELAANKSSKPLDSCGNVCPRSHAFRTQAAPRACVTTSMHHGFLLSKEALIAPQQVSHIGSFFATPQAERHANNKRLARFICREQNHKKRVRRV
jgi:hypothetical protein